MSHCPLLILSFSSWTIVPKEECIYINIRIAQLCTQSCDEEESVQATIYNPQLSVIVRSTPAAIVITTGEKEEVSWRSKK